VFVVKLFQGFLQFLCKPIGVDRDAQAKTTLLRLYDILKSAKTLIGRQF